MVKWFYLNKFLKNGYKIGINKMVPKIEKNLLIIIDYSGTLSLSTCLFGTDKYLIDAFKTSGLWDLGVKNINFFWKDLISSTWDEGATTSIGYNMLLSKKLIELKFRDEKKIIQACQSFTELYLQNSNIENEWFPILRSWQKNPLIMILIVTDHYIEMTQHISSQLDIFGLNNIALDKNLSSYLTHKSVSSDNSIIIANSANLGCLKQSMLFWNQIKACLSQYEFEQLLILDDFGYNENINDEYSQNDKIQKRKDKILDIITHYFPLPFLCYPFFLKSIHSGDNIKIMTELNSSLDLIQNSIKAYQI